MSRLSVLVVLIVLVSGILPDPAQAGGPWRTPEELLAAYTEALENRDAQALMTLYYQKDVSEELRPKFEMQSKLLAKMGSPKNLVLGPVPDDVAFK